MKKLGARFDSVCLGILLCLVSAELFTHSAAEATRERTAANSTKAKIDLNKASEAELESLPGVGPATAAQITAARPFKNVAELKNVTGIGETRYKELEKHVTVSRGTTANTKSAQKISPTDRSANPPPPPKSTSRAARIDLNTADAATLESLPGVGPAIAQDIIAARPFKSVDDLKKVRGIGDARFQEVRPLVTVRETSPRQGGGAAAGSPAPSTSGKSSPEARRTPIPQPRTAQLPSTSERRININTASKEELESLLGIGPVKAQAIIDRRPYNSIEEVMEVNGIKEGTFEKIQDRITVR